MKRMFPALALLVLIANAVHQSGCSTLPHYTRTGSRPADLVIFNADVFTSAADRPWAEAVAVKSGRISYVGDNAGAADFVGTDTRLLNVRGKMLTPGFVDNHCHVLWIGAILSLLPKDRIAHENLDQFKEAVRKQARENPDLVYVNGGGWHYRYLPGGRPDRAILDEVCSDRPVISGAYDGQGGWANTAGLNLMRERNSEAFEALGPVRDGTSGEYTGEFRHFHAFNPFDFFTLKEFGPEAEKKMMETMADTLRDALSVGVTTVNDVQIYSEFVPVLLRFREQGGLQDIRARCSLYIDPGSLKDERRLREKLDWWKKLGKKESDGHFVLGDSLKFYIDGTAGNRTALMLEPYSNDPGSAGEPVWSQEDFNRVIEIIDARGLQACTHNCGDAGARRVINAYQHAQSVNGERDSRHRLDHCELPTPEDRERMARLGIVAAMQPTHFFGEETLESALGPERLKRLMPWRSLEKAGVSVSFGSDWAAGPINPVYGLLVAANRLNYHGNDDWGSEERIAVEDAIRHWTIDSARALFLEREIGSIEEGKCADMVLFDIDLRDLDSWWFLLTHDVDLGKLDDFVLMTMVDGRIVYQPFPRTPYSIPD